MIKVTFDWLVCLSLARKILEMGPNGRKSSCRSDSVVSSDKLVTRMVADSSNDGQKNQLRTMPTNTEVFCTIYDCGKADLSKG